MDPMTTSGRVVGLFLVEKKTTKMVRLIDGQSGDFNDVTPRRPWHERVSFHQVNSARVDRRHATCPNRIEIWQRKLPCFRGTSQWIDPMPRRRVIFYRVLLGLSGDYPAGISSCGNVLCVCFLFAGHGERRAIRWRAPLGRISPFLLNGEFDGGGVMTVGFWRSYVSYDIEGVTRCQPLGPLRATAFAYLIATIKRPYWEAMALPVSWPSIWPNSCYPGSRWST